MNAKQLRDALGQVKRFARDPVAHPLMGCVHFDPGSLSATNLEVTARLACEHGVQTAISVPHGPITRALTGLAADEPVDLRVEDHHLVVSALGVDALVPGMEREGFTLPRPVREWCVRVTSAAYGELRSVAGAASRDEARPILTGVHVEAGAADLMATATDSYRLHHTEVMSLRSQVAGGGVEAIVPHAALVAMPGEIVELCIGTTGFVTLRSDSLEVTARAIEGAPVAWRDLLPVNPTRVELAKGTSKTVSRVAGMVPTSAPLRMRLNQGLMHLESRAEDVANVRADIALAEAWSGEPDLECGYNAAFFAEAVRFADQTLEVVNERRPCRLVAGRRFALLMPVHLSG